MRKEIKRIQLVLNQIKHQKFWFFIISTSMQNFRTQHIKESLTMPAITDNTSALDALFDLEFNGLLAIIDEMLSIRCRINNIHTQNVLVVIGIDDFFLF